MVVPKFFIIGNPQNRRVRYVQEALANRRLPPATVLAYFDLLKERTPLDELIPPGAFVRIDSPEEDFEVEKYFLREGILAAEAEGSPFLDATAISRLAPARGLILFPRQWYLGFCAVLTRWDEHLRRIPGIHCLTPPTDIQVLFDKCQCHLRCQVAGIAVPSAWKIIKGYDDFVQQSHERPGNRAFIKLAHGSSASGVVAWRRQGTRQVAITSAELVRDGQSVRLYNSLKIRRYTDTRDIADLINVLAAERAHVEDWFLKGSVAPGRCFDLRIVTVAGEPRHTVVRQSSNPMTNLHLGNERGDLKVVLEKLGSEQLASLHQTCRQTASLFPKSLMLGLDIAIGPRFRRHVLLEANAFGDLLPGIQHQGVDTYTAQVDAIFDSHFGVPESSTTCGL